MAKKVVITGVAGFLGFHIADKLLSEGCTVIGVDNLSTGRMDSIRRLSSSENFHFILHDAVSPDIRQTALLRQADEIYHLASPASPRFYQAAPLETILANTMGTLHMLDLARETGAKLLYTSTSEAYGDPEVHPQPEHYRGSVNTWGPRACYDESKRLGETLCYEYYDQFKVPVTVARLFNTYSAGLRNDDGRVISNFVTQALHGEDLTVYGDGSQTRSFCYVDDTVRGLLLMMDRTEADGQIINIGNPTETSILEVALLVRRLAGSGSRITFHPLPQDDPKVRRPDIAKARKLLNWQPEVELEEGLRRMIAQYRKLFGTTMGGNHL